MNHQKVEKLEKSTGHKFLNEERLRRALTHSSVQDQTHGNYERLEFLGDRVLGLLVSEMLFGFYPRASEGELSVRLNGLVNAATCLALATLCRSLFAVIPMLKSKPPKLSNIMQTT